MKTFAIAVKQPSGRWLTINVLEVRIAEPVEAYKEDTRTERGWIVGIRARGASDTPAPQDDSMFADPLRDVSELERKRGEHDDEEEQHPD
jgi:hypothetical protein